MLAQRLDTPAHIVQDGSRAVGIAEPPPILSAPALKDSENRVLNNEFAQLFSRDVSYLREAKVRKITASANTPTGMGFAFIKPSVIIKIG